MPEAARCGSPDCADLTILYLSLPQGRDAALIPAELFVMPFVDSHPKLAFYPPYAPCVIKARQCA